MSLVALGLGVVAVAALAGIAAGALAPPRWRPFAVGALTALVGFGALGPRMLRAASVGPGSLLRTPLHDHGRQRSTNQPHSDAPVPRAPRRPRTFGPRVR
jgi:hypothetical protein